MNDFIFYSFRRCPYCMRAHMGLKISGVKIELREVELKQMPAEILTITGKATVPVLILNDNNVIDESWDVLKWALLKNDPDNWLGDNQKFVMQAEMLVETNDFSFKNDLDHYKYADRYPEHSVLYYRQVCEDFIEELEQMLSAHSYLLANQISIADIAIFPFIRQFSLVDKNWFEQSNYTHVRTWLNALINSPLFQKVFQKHALWQPGNKPVYL